ncbi:MAG: hypothetical protein UR60_C0007G0017 [Candidatus Moranbacteria bacterium GW2011_GWF2_34_56]|nr:MAG: hypothetical protein UR51_C0001G0017 [Candidatus Moranbacteria bacterium GW2011_GWF1_34_10]KKP65167.1 MAG: hypothetical protein UR60_C0007G0017 [Candidatus Moranbacteria bacterium GW2011_GWF2_34_56]HBI17394.1 hypothetical protein [Candidatus Moranbacteria bacterium]
MKINKDWTVIKDNNVGNTKNISDLKATPIKWEDALTLSDGMSYKDLLEGLGPQINNANDEEFEDMRNRWGNYILIFPGTQCQDTVGNILVPAIRYVQQMIQLGEVRMAWDFEWFNYSKWEGYQHMGRLGATGYMLDINNHYGGIAILKGGDK